MITPQDESAAILLGHPDAGRRAALRAELESNGHSVVSEASIAAELAEKATDVQVEVILTAPHFADATGTSALIAAAKTEPRPGIVIVEEPERALIEEALRDHVMAFVVEPTTGAELKPLIHLVRERFAEFQDLRSQGSDLESARALDALADPDAQAVDASPV